jgi:hypothetical protein
MAEERLRDDTEMRYWWYIFAWRHFRFNNPLEGVRWSGQAGQTLAIMKEADSAALDVGVDSRGRVTCLMM